jgi:hypothetical protein
LPGLILAAILAFSIFFGNPNPHERVRQSNTRALIHSIDVGLEAFRADFGHLPTDALDGGSETNDPRWIRLWLLGIDDHGEPSDAVRSDPKWDGPYVDVKIGGHLDVDNGWVFIDAWRKPILFELREPVFNLKSWDIWSLGRNGAGTTSMGELAGVTPEEKQETYGNLRVRNKPVNADNVGNW